MDPFTKCVLKQRYETKAKALAAVAALQQKGGLRPYRCPVAPEGDGHYHHLSVPPCSGGPFYSTVHAGASHRPPTRKITFMTSAPTA